MRKILGTCTRCAKDDCRLTIIDDVDRVCDDCLDSFYTQCEDCGNYWEEGCIEFFLTSDERMICEYCRENYDDDDIVEDDA